MTILKNDTDNDNDREKNQNKEYSSRSKKTDKTYQCIKTLINCYLIAFLNKSLTCDQAVLLPFLFGRRGEGNAGFIYFTRRLPVVQNLDFCLIGRKTKDPSEPYTHRSRNISDIRSYQIGFVTSWPPAPLHEPRNDTEEKTLDS